jgi:hypothetical protein
MELSRWNYKTRSYQLYVPDPSWKIRLFSEDMDEPINCTNCGKDMVFGNGFTSQEIHTEIGLGYPVCEECYEKETDRRQQAKAQKGDEMT